jgi:catechol 2,3-dioxygenase-like lactoylglutathione lyase family enzyme
MKLKSVSGYVCYVKDIKKTAKFYKDLGFKIETNEPDRLSIRLNWFWIDFHPQDKNDIPDFQRENNLENKGAGIFIYLSVDDVDEAYKYLIDRGHKPSSEPQDYPWGNREFVIRDPDGYKLALFKRQKPRNPAE